MGALCSLRMPTSLRDLLDRRHLPGLDGLRAIAVGVVVLYHTGLASFPAGEGVEGFFVLSGFLITWLLIKELEATGRISFKAFYLRRTLRIFPAYYVFVAVSLAWDWIRHDHWTSGRIAAALLYFINYHNAVTGHEGPITHAWSLAIEEQFYLLWPVVFVLLARGGMARVRAGLTIAILVVTAWRSFLYLVMHVGSAYVYNAFDTRCDSLAIGCLIAAWSTSPRFLSFARALASHPLLPLLPLAGIAISRYATPLTYHYSLGLTVDPALMAILIIQILQLTASPLWHWLEWDPIRYLGRISYPIYLWHVFAVAIARRLADGLPAHVVLGVLLSIVVASLSYYVVERPALRLKARLDRRIRGDRAGPPSVPGPPGLAPMGPTNVSLA